MTKKLVHRKIWLNNCYQIYSKYSDLLDSYVLDYFTKKHWDKLPESWQCFLENLSVDELANLLQYNQPLRCGLPPLSLLALKKCLEIFCLPRKVSILGNIQKSTFIEDTKLMKLFWKNIKLKKRHEIYIMTKVTYKKAIETDCFYIVDIGSGLGHLSRLLTFGYGFRVCAIEAQKQLCDEARKLDSAFEKVLLKSEKYNNSYIKTVHVNMRINPSTTPEQFLEIVAETFNIKDIDKFCFGIVGLHPCGDLGATLLKLYSKCPNISFINLVGCCYMKLTTCADEYRGYPLSSFGKESNYDLTYSSLEVACHAVENYIKKLQEGEHWKLKIHAYRAVIEKLIVSEDPSLSHSALNSVKYSSDLTFEDYCARALSKLKLIIPKEKIFSVEVEECLKGWYKVVLFYSIRLLLASLVETIILLDRQLYAEETGNVCDIIPVFDPEISPRNQVISCKKKTSW